MTTGKNTIWTNKNQYYAGYALPSHKYLHSSAESATSKETAIITEMDKYLQLVETV
jgi:hypothetical protein